MPYETFQKSAKSWISRWKNWKMTQVNNKLPNFMCKNNKRRVDLVKLIIWKDHTFHEMSTIVFTKCGVTFTNTSVKYDYINPQHLLVFHAFRKWNSTSSFFIRFYKHRDLHHTTTIIWATRLQKMLKPHASVSRLLFMMDSTKQKAWANNLFAKAAVKTNVNSIRYH